MVVLRMDILRLPAAFISAEVGSSSVAQPAPPAAARLDKNKTPFASQWSTCLCGPGTRHYRRRS